MRLLSSWLMLGTTATNGGVLARAHHQLVWQTTQPQDRTATYLSASHLDLTTVCARIPYRSPLVVPEPCNVSH